MKNPLHFNFGIEYSKKAIILLALMLSLFTASGQEVWGTHSSGGTDNLGTLGHYDMSTFSWSTDYNFTTQFPGGSSKRSQLTEVDGKFYGITGGGNGLLFEWDPLTNAYIKKFDFNLANGSSPVGSLTYSDGKLYGMTSAGGVYGGGVIFEWDMTTNIYTKKFDFGFTFGYAPQGSLTYFEGKFYGMTVLGGLYSSGVIFEWDPATNVYTKKIDFADANGTQPNGSLTYGGGKFYGMTRFGGTNNAGVIFEWDSFTNLYTKKFDFNGIDGSNPVAALTYDGQKFYGLTTTGGANGWGVLFEWDPLSNAYTKKLDFRERIGGSQPWGSLTYTGGKFYGTTFYGGTAALSDGVLFEWDPTTNVYTEKFDFNNADGENPFGSLSYSSGKLFGTTYTGGANNYGVIFQWDIATNVYTKKIDFGIAINGTNPQGSLAYVGGKFYGATRTGGDYGYGVLFEWDPVGMVYTKKHDFNYANGAYPEGSLAYHDGKLYGLTTQGGATNEGVLFEWEPATNLYVKKNDFTRDLGSYPVGALTKLDGKFYGVTQSGGAAGRGVIFEWDPSSNIYIKKIDFTCSGGCHPQTTMTVNQGKLYGMTNVGGIDDRGVIFEWDPVTNVYTKKIDLNDDIGSLPWGSALTYLGGKFYGTTTYGGGTIKGGVLFEWDPATNLYNKKVDFYEAARGGPRGSLISNGGKLYGTTIPGGGTDLGIVFEWNPTTSEFIKKIDFNTETGVGPQPFLLIEPDPGPVNTPAMAASNISFSNVLPTSLTVSFTPGDGTNHLVVIKAGSAPTFLPVDDTFYSGDLGNGESVVYNGTDSTFNVTDLQSHTEYFFTIFEFNKNSTTSRYLIDGAPVASTYTLNSTIEDFSLIRTKSGLVVLDFDDTLTLDIAYRDLEKYTIRANVITEVGSVKFTMDGLAANIENYKPYTLSPWILNRLSAGVHTLGGQAYSKKNAQGQAFEKREANIIIINSAAVTQFDLVNKKTGALIRTLLDGDVINIRQEECKDFTIVARTNVNTTESVKFSLNGAVGIDNHRPYQLNRHKKINPGSYTLTATPFVKDNAWGPPGIPLTVHFSVINVPIPLLVVDQGLVVVNEEVGRSEDLNSPQVAIYPVPVTDELTISIKDVMANNFILKIMDMNGKTVYTSEGTGDNLRPIIIGTNRLGLSRGMYVIYIRQLNGSVLMKKFVKE